MEYFTPKIEDIRIGYQCELRENFEWYPETINLHDFTNIGRGNNLLTLETAIYMERIRVPFLTKEQIIAEGWKYRGHLSGEYDKDMSEALLSMQKIINENHYGLYLSHKFHLSLSKWNSKEGTSTLYRGECKSINEFRYISKLLNIQ